MSRVEAAETVLHKLYSKLGKKGSNFKLTPDLIEKKAGNKDELAVFLFDFVNIAQDCMKVLKSGCVEVDTLKSETKSAYKEFLQ